MSVNVREFDFGKAVGTLLRMSKWGNCLLVFACEGSLLDLQDPVESSKVASPLS